MSSARDERIEALFQEAADLPERERSAFLCERCGEDYPLQTEVECLLAHYAAAEGRFLAQPAHQLEAVAEDEDALPRRLGHFELVRMIGFGGMSEVYEARQNNPPRTVALKVIRPGLASRQMIRRFQRESELLARLQHPGIAHIYETGMAGAGGTGLGLEGELGAPSAGDPNARAAHPRILQPYFAMELIHGEPLNEYANNRRLTPRHRLELVAKICDAVQHAHQHGVIHRDLKPANILVAEGDEGTKGLRDQGTEGVGVPWHFPSIPGSAQPKVLDFGVARATNADLQSATLQTGVGQLIGTVPYMSPEQVAGDPDQVDTRSDVYALGVILYELLAGTLPYDVAGCALPEAVRRIRDEQPPRLGTVNRAYRGEIEIIAARALEKDPARRYQSAAALGIDIRRYLAGEPIEARRDSALYVMRKSIARHRGVVAAASLLLLALALFGIVSSRQAQKNLRLAGEERLARQEAVAARERADAEAAAARRALYFSRIGFAQAALEGNDVGRVVQLLDACPQDLRDWEWHYLRRLADRSNATVSWPEGPLTTALLSADGRRIFTWRLDGKLGVFDAQSRALLQDFDLDEQCAAIAATPDGRRVVTARRDGELLMWDAATGSKLLSMHDESQLDLPPSGTRVRALAFSPDGTRLASGGDDGALRLWDTQSGSLLKKYLGRGNHITCLDFTPDGRRVVTGGADAALRVWEVATGAVLAALLGHRLSIHCLAVSPDGGLLASGSNDAGIRLWDMTEFRELAVLEGHRFSVPSLRFSPDGRLLVSGGVEHTIRIWDVAERRLIHALRGHVDEVKYVSFTPDGATIVSAGRDGALKWWSAATTPDTPIIRTKPHGATRSLSFSPDGRRLLVCLPGGSFRVWDAETREEVLAATGHPGRSSEAAFSPDGSRIVSTGPDGTIKVWDARAGNCLQTHAARPSELPCIAMAPDGARVAWGDDAGELNVLDVRDGRVLFALRAHDGAVRTVAFSPDGSCIASGGGDGAVKIWDAFGGAQRSLLAGHDRLVYMVAYSPDGSRIASVGQDGFLNTWDTADGRALLRAAAHRGAALGVCFNPDGSRLVTCGDDHTIRVWAPATGEEVLTLRGHERLVQRVAFSPDGSRLASTSDDGTIRFWESDAQR